MGTRDFTKALTYLTVTSVEAGYRAGLIAGLREAAIIARNSCLVEPDGGAPTEYERLTAERAEERIRARITALEEEK